MEKVHVHGMKGDTVRQEPQYVYYTCGHCGAPVHGCFVVLSKRNEGSRHAYALCGCGKGTALALTSGTTVVEQWPAPRDYYASKDWPDEVQPLFNEAAESYRAGAYTAAAMVCRKILMVTSHLEDASPNESFKYYVDYLAGEVLTFPRATKAIDRIRDIGNAANHEPDLVEKPDAEDAMRITKYLLDSLYAFAGAVPDSEPDTGGGSCEGEDA